MLIITSTQNNSDLYPLLPLVFLLIKKSHLFGTLCAFFFLNLYSIEKGGNFSSDGAAGWSFLLACINYMTH